MDKNQPPTGGEASARKRYESLEHYRRPFLDRARQCASLTLPYLLPPEGHTTSSVLPTPYQSVGARGLTNLAAKLVMTLFPPHQAFFSHKIDRYIASKEDIEPEDLTTIQTGLAAMERAALRRSEASGIRPTMNEAMLRVLATGNAMIYAGKKKDDSRIFPLDRFVVRRNVAGRIMEFITLDDISRAEVNAEFRDQLPKSRSDVPPVQQVKDAQNQDDSYGLYTWGRLEGNRWHIVQEVEGIVVNEGYESDDSLRYIPLRFNRTAGEDYGRGFVEQYLGDLVRLESLSKAIVEGAAAGSKVVFFVDPNGITNVTDVSEAENLDVLSGRAEDISTMQVQKYADFRVTLETIRDIERRLEFAFLLHTALQRGGERVTAEEIRTLAEELENALGGVYSLFSLELQTPLAKLYVQDLSRDEGYPKLPEDLVTTKIVTGIDALGRAHEGFKLRQWLQDYAAVVGPERVARRLNDEEYAKRSAASQGVDIEGLLRTDDEIAAEENQQRAQALAEKAVGPAAGQAVKGIADNLNTQPAEQQPE